MKTKTKNGLLILVMLSLVSCIVVLPAQAAEKPDAKLSVTPTSGKAPLTVTFTDQSTGNPLYKWWGFGDGTGSSSTAKKITHTYTKAGKYTVFLKVTNQAGTDTETYPTPIIVGQKPNAKFSVTPTSGKAPLTVTFTDQSTGNPLYKWWGFGDGTGSSSTAKKITHTYTKAGKYTVFLKVTNQAGTDTETKSSYIIVKAPQSSGIVTDARGNSYDLYNINGKPGRYAKKSTHAQEVQSILDKMGKIKTPQDITNYIKKYSPESPVTADMIIKATNKCPGVSWEIMMAIMREDSNFADPRINSNGKMSPEGPRQRAYRTHNPGNVGNVDSGANTYFNTWQDGINAEAENLYKRIPRY